MPGAAARSLGDGRKPIGQRPLSGPGTGRRVGEVQFGKSPVLALLSFGIFWLSFDELQSSPSSASSRSWLTQPSSADSQLAQLGPT